MISTEIEFKHIGKRYEKRVLFNDLNLTIDKKEFVTVIGSSGCGKTTLLKMINGLVLPDEGVVSVKGKNIINENLIELRRNIGYSVQGNVLFPHMTVEQNISYVPSLVNKGNKDRTKKAVRKWMDIVGLDYEMLTRYPDELSGGQQQRVGIARSLAASPDILLMDEPFGAVDEITRAKLQKEITDIHKQTGITIVFVTHDISEALKLGTKVIVLHEGIIQQYDKPEEILKNPANKTVMDLVKNNPLYDKYQTQTDFEK